MRRGILWAACAAVALLCAPTAWAEAQFKMRASVDTSLGHARTQAVADYLKQVQERSGGRIETELFHSGQLYRDRDVVKALRQGSIEMAAPGNWVLTGLVPDADVFQLPIFFGQRASVAYAAATARLARWSMLRSSKSFRSRSRAAGCPSDTRTATRLRSRSGALTIGPA